MEMLIRNLMMRWMRKMKVKSKKRKLNSNLMKSKMMIPVKKLNRIQIERSDLLKLTLRE